MQGEEVLSEFLARVSDFVKRSLSDYRPERHAKPKSIRDAIWGTCPFNPWEIAILDSPLLQRLRDLRQTGVASLVYPTALHTRFDHTLGVVTVASRIVRSINEKHLERRAPGGPQDLRISHKDHRRVRLSALLHDVGHSCLSHVSETIFGATEEFGRLIRHINVTFGVTPKPHEIMSWLVVRCEAFGAFIDTLRQSEILPESDFSPGDIEDIAGNIIGYRKDPKTKFLADIINGPMDADKLDYLARDAYFAGPTVVYDLDRFLHTVDAIEYPRCGPTAEEPTVARLSIPIEGVTALEQIIISKLMLFSYLYHHHKIRCVEGMCHEALARCMEVSKRHPRAKTYPRLDHPVSFLSHSDRSLFPVSWPPPVMGDKVAGELFSMLARRELYKRALIISRLFLLDLDANDHAKFGFERLLGYGTDAAGRGELRQHIFEVAKKEMGSRRHREAAKGLLRRFRPHHVIVDIPRSPTVEETEAVMVPVLAEGTRGAHHANQDFVPLSDIFPIEKWVDAYNAIKWRGHVFAVDEAVRFVNAAARAVLAAPPYNLQFTYQATDLCKLDEPIPLPPAIGRSLLAGV